MGAQIIEAITSGLGLVSTLANQFLSAFSGLVWDSTANSGAGALTPLAIFAFVMVGVAITFGVLGKVFNLLTSNTAMN